MYDIFISHSRADASWSKKLAQALSKKGMRVFHDQTSTKKGEPFQKQMEQALRQSKVIVPVISSKEMNPNQAFELGAALGSKRTLIPVVDDSVPSESIPGPIRRRNYLHKGNPDQTAARIIEGIAKRNGKGKPSPLSRLSDKEIQQLRQIDESLRRVVQERRAGSSSKKWRVIRAMR